MKFKIQTSSSIPIHKQIEKQIRKFVNQSPDMSLLPSYSQVSREHGIAVNTVRQAYNKLCTEGILIQKQGHGTFTVAPKIGKGKVMLLFPNTPNYYFYDILMGVSEKIKTTDFELYTFVMDKKEDEKKIIQESLKNGTHTFILFPNNENLEFYRELKNEGVHIIFINNFFPEALNEFHLVTTDDFSACYEMGKQLATKLTGDVIFLTRSALHTPFKNRKEGYLKAFEEAGILAKNQFHIIDMEHENMQLKDIVTRFKNLLQKSQLVLTDNDFTAMELIKIFHTHKITTPNDIGVIGYSDLLISQFFQPALTTIKQNGFEVGHQVVELLFEHEETKQIFCKCEPMFRETFLL